MKTLLNILLAVFFLSRSGPAQGFIVPNGVINVGLWSGVGYEIDVSQNQSASDYTGFFLNPIGKTPPTLYTNTFSYSYIVDEGVRVFLVPSNAPISLESILSQGWTELGAAPSYVFTNGVPFYVGLYTGYNPFALTNIDGHITSYYTGIYTDPVFGWAELRNFHGTIQLLDSALEYGGAGIYAGTPNLIQPVPEPGELALVALGTLRFGCRGWRKFSQ